VARESKWMVRGESELTGICSISCGMMNTCYSCKTSETFATVAIKQKKELLPKVTNAGNICHHSHQTIERFAAAAVEQQKQLLSQQICHTLP
jgi:hypothetical protein